MDPDQRRRHRDRLATAAGAQGHLPLATEVLTAGLPAEVVRDVEGWLLVPRPAAAHPAFRPVELLQRHPEVMELPRNL